MSVVDCTAFYLSLANASLFFNQHTQWKGLEYGDFEESSKYFSLCLNQVTQRLRREIAQVSEGVITTVLGFLCHDVCIPAPCQPRNIGNPLNSLLSVDGIVSPYI